MRGPDQLAPRSTLPELYEQAAERMRSERDAGNPQAAAYLELSVENVRQHAGEIVSAYRKSAMIVPLLIILVSGGVDRESVTISGIVSFYLLAQSFISPRYQARQELKRILSTRE